MKSFSSPSSKADVVVVVVVAVVVVVVAVVVDVVVSTFDCYFRPKGF